MIFFVIQKFLLINIFFFSQRETRTSELVMIERMFNNDEQMTFNMLREQEAKANGKFFLRIL